MKASVVLQLRLDVGDSAQWADQRIEYVGFGSCKYWKGKDGSGE